MRAPRSLAFVLVLGSTACDRPSERSDEVAARPTAELAPASPGASSTPDAPKPPPGYDWVAYDSQEGRFSIQFPKPPQHSTLPAPSEFGLLIFDTYMAEFDSVTFAVMVVEYPAELVAQGSVSGMLDGARDGALANTNGRLLSERALEVDGHPARRLRMLGVDQNVEITLDAMLIIVDNRLYQALVSSVGGERPDANEWFLTSFHPRALH